MWMHNAEAASPSPDVLPVRGEIRHLLSCSGSNPLQVAGKTSSPSPTTIALLLCIIIYISYIKGKRTTQLFSISLTNENSVVCRPASPTKTSNWEERTHCDATLKYGFFIANTAVVVVVAAAAVVVEC